MELLDNPNLKPNGSAIDQIDRCLAHLQSEKEKQCFHSHKTCVDFLDYTLKRASPDEHGNKSWVSIGPDYSLLAKGSPENGACDFAYEMDPIRLAALELAVSLVEMLSSEITWADPRGREWKNSLIVRLATDFL